MAASTHTCRCLHDRPLPAPPRNTDTLQPDYTATHTDVDSTHSLPGIPNAPLSYTDDGDNHGTSTTTHKACRSKAEEKSAFKDCVSIEAAVESLLIKDRWTAESTISRRASLSALPPPPSTSRLHKTVQAARLPRRPISRTPLNINDLGAENPVIERPAPPAIHSETMPGPARDTTRPLPKLPSEHQSRAKSTIRRHVIASENEFLRTLVATYANTSAEGRAFVRVHSVGGLSRFLRRRTESLSTNSEAATGPQLYWLVGCEDQVAYCRPVAVHGDHVEFNKEFTVPIRRGSKAIVLKLVASGPTDFQSPPVANPAPTARRLSASTGLLRRKPVGAQPPPVPFRRQVGDVIVGEATVSLASCRGQDQLVHLLQYPHEPSETASVRDDRLPSSKRSSFRWRSRVLGTLRCLPAGLAAMRSRSIGHYPSEGSEQSDGSQIDLDISGPVVVAEALISTTVWPCTSTMVAGLAPVSFEECCSRIGELWRLDGLLSDVTHHFENSKCPLPPLGTVLDLMSRLGSAKLLGNPSVKMMGCMFWKQKSCVLTRPYLLFFAVSSNPNHSIFHCALDLSLATGVDGPDGANDGLWFPPENGFRIRFGGAGGSACPKETEFAEFSMPDRVEAEKWVAAVKRIVCGLAPA